MKNSADLMDLVAGYREYAGAEELSADSASPNFWGPWPPLPTRLITTVRWAC